MLVNVQCNTTVKGTVDTSCPCKLTERVVCARCCLAFRQVYIQYPGYCTRLRHLHAQVRAVSDKCLVHVHGCPLLAGNYLGDCIQYPVYCKNLRHLHAQVRAVLDEFPVQSLLRSKLFKTNVQCMYIVVLCFLEIT